MSDPTSTDGFFRWDRISAADAKEGLDRLIQAQPGLAQSLVRRASDNGGPSELMDFSVGSLRPVWKWFAATARVAPMGDLPADPSVLELWMRADPGRVKMIGVEYAWFVTEIAGYFAEVVGRHAPVEWLVGKGDIKNRPVWLAPGLELINFPQVMCRAYEQQLLSNDDHLLRLALAAADGAGTLPEPMYHLEPAESQVSVFFCDEIAHEYEEVVEKAEELLLGLEGVEIVDGDREVIVVERDGFSATRLSALVRLPLAALQDPRF